MEDAGDEGAEVKQARKVMEKDAGAEGRGALEMLNRVPPPVERTWTS
jgi:hypothetical protein